MSAAIANAIFWVAVLVLYLRGEIKYPVKDQKGQPASIFIRLIPFLLFVASLLFSGLAVLLDSYYPAMFMLFLAVLSALAGIAIGIGRRVKWKAGKSRRRR